MLMYDQGINSKDTKNWKMEIFCFNHVYESLNCEKVFEVQTIQFINVVLEIDKYKHFLYNCKLALMLMQSCGSQGLVASSR